MFATTIFCLCMFLALWMTIVMVGKTVMKNDVHWLIIMIAAASWTGVITHLMHIW